MALTILGILALIFRLALIMSRRLCVFMLCGLTSVTSLEDVCLLTAQCSYSDFFVIYQLGSAMEPLVFREVMQRLIYQLKKNA